VIRAMGTASTCLVNAAGGNQPEATVPVGGSFFDLDADGFRSVVELNLMGTFLATQVFCQNDGGARERERRQHFPLSPAQKALSRVAGYGAAKAGVENLTAGLADHIAPPGEPGYPCKRRRPRLFPRAQNRALLTEADGSLSERGRTVVARTPMGRLGSPEDLVGTVPVARVRRKRLRHWDRGGGGRRFLGSGRDMSQVPAALEQVVSATAEAGQALGYDAIADVLAVALEDVVAGEHVLVLVPDRNPQPAVSRALSRSSGRRSTGPPGSM